ncbi:MAG: tail fiber domain-containing protein, partial [Chitinophagales bacterium]
ASLSANTTGSLIVAVGSSAGSVGISNSYSTFLGASSGISGVGPYTYSTAIGYSAVVDASNQVRVGTASTTSIGGYVNWTNISDGRFKTNVQENVPGLDFIMALRPVTYNLDVAAINVFHHIPDSLTDKNGVAQKTNQIQTGFIAQEVEITAQKLNYDFSGVDVPQNDESTYGLRYAEFVVPLVKAVQEQQAQIEMLQKLVAEQNELIKKIMQE